MVIKLNVKKILIVGLVILMAGLFIAFYFVFKSFKTASPKHTITIVLDAGHGGRDDGCTGASGSKEAEINLAIVKKAESIFKDFGINVVLTRTNENALYDEGVENYKKDDMDKRKNIIENAKPDFVISVHMNSYTNSSERGAQVYYKEGDEKGKNFADAIQKCFINQLESARNNSNFGDYYMFNCVEVPSVIVECGFITNPQDEALLLTSDYQEKVAYAMLCGVLSYFNISKSLSEN